MRSIVERRERRRAPGRRRAAANVAGRGTSPLAAPTTETATTSWATGRPGRVTSLDWVRGLLLCWSITSAATLGPRPAAMKHAEWIGVTPEDLIFPLFVTLSGCGLAFAYRNHVGWSATVRRCLVLLLCGLAYNAVVAGTLDPGDWRWTGPLQVYAVLVGLIGLLHLVARTAAAWAGITAVAAAGQALLLAWWAGGCPAAALTPGCNPSRVIDTAWMGAAHMYAGGQRGHDPEGAVAVLGAFVTAAVGVTAGHLMLRARGSYRMPVHLVGWAAVVLASAALLETWVPAMKRLWTAPFALGAASLGVLALIVGATLLDLPARPAVRRLRERLAWPWVAMGRNSLLLYFGSHLVMFVLLTRGEPTSYAEQLAAQVEVLGHPRASLVVVNLLAWAAIAAVLHRRRIYLRP